MSADWVDAGTFRTVISAAPLVSIDLVVRREDGQMLLGQRKNRPAKGYWFTPEGRIRKGETLDEAFLRLTFAELGVAFARQSSEFLGVYEHFYEDSVFGADATAPSTHSVVLAYHVSYSAQFETLLPLDQHSKFRWAKPAEILLDRGVHPNTQAYVHDLK